LSFDIRLSRACFGARRSCSEFPGCEVIALLTDQFVYTDPHRFKLEPRDLVIKVRRNRINVVLKLLPVPC